MSLQAATGTVAGRPEQHVERIGFRPVAVVLWWSSQTTEGRVRGCCGGIGFVGDGASGAAGWYADDGTELTRAGTASADAALVVARPGAEPARAHVDLTDDGFSIRWEPSPELPVLVDYVALGGIPNAASGRVSSRSMTLGFEPDVVFLASARSAPGLLAAVGAAVAGGGQAGSSFLYPDAASPEAVAGAQREDAALVIPRADRADAATLVRVVPTASGFDVTCEGQDAPEMIYLALGGVRCRLGVESAPRKPGLRRARVGFRPDALIAFTWGLGAATAPRDIGRLCIGAATGASDQRTVVWYARDIPAPQTATGSVASSSQLLLVPDTQGDRLHASARVEELHDDGFSLRWLESDGRPRRFVYVALADRAVRLRRGRPWLGRLFGFL